MFKANALCNQMGLDVDAAGGPSPGRWNVTSGASSTRKIRTVSSCNWGDADVILELIRRICYGKASGIFSPRAAAKAADLIGRGSGYYAMHIKGQDLYEPLRGALGWCLGTTTSTRGGGHTTGAAVDARIGVRPGR